MQVSWSATATFTLIVFLAVVAAVWISKSWWWQRWKDKYMNSPALALAQSDNKEALGVVMGIIPQLNINERELLLAMIFGKPIKLVKNVSPDGRQWLEVVSSVDTDYESSPLEDSGGIG